MYEEAQTNSRTCEGVTKDLSITDHDWSRSWLYITRPIEEEVS